MAWLDRLKERLTGTPAATRTPDPGAPAQRSAAGRDPDEVAVERYRYMLRTAPPETIEQAHTEAFATLTPEQRRRVLAELGSAVPAAERARTDDPRDLARMATRAELQQPGIMERTLRGPGTGGMGMGGMIAGSLLASVAGAFIGTAIAGAFFDDYGFGDGYGDGYGEGYADGLAADDQAGDPSGVADDPGGFGDPGGDLGGDFGGDFGGDDLGI